MYLMTAIESFIYYHVSKAKKKKEENIQKKIFFHSTLVHLSDCFVIHRVICIEMSEMEHANDRIVIFKVNFRIAVRWFWGFPGQQYICTNIQFSYVFQPYVLVFRYGRFIFKVAIISLYIQNRIHANLLKYGKGEFAQAKTIGQN